MKYKIGDKVRAIVSDPRVANTIVTITDVEKVMDIQYYVAQDTNGEKWGFSEDELEPVAIRSLLFPNVEYVFNEKQAEELAERLNKKLAGRFNAFPNNGISAKNGGKNSMKFTFYVTDWVDIDKTNGEKIPMKKTVAYIGSNSYVKADTSCPVAEYDERIGCLIAAAKISAKRSTEAKMMYNIARSTWGTELSWAILFELANAAFNDNFERVYKKFHNDNIRFEKKRLTCNFCGKVFETIEEKTKHENEHIQNKKNKREKYLIRKEAKRRLAEAEREGKIEKAMKELYKK